MLNINEPHNGTKAASTKALKAVGETITLILEIGAVTTLLWHAIGKFVCSYGVFMYFGDVCIWSDIFRDEDSDKLIKGCTNNSEGPLRERVHISRRYISLYGYKYNHRPILPFAVPLELVGRDLDGRLLKAAGDNWDHNESTCDGKRTTHAMTSLLTVHGTEDGRSTVCRIPRLQSCTFDTRLSGKRFF